uniref:Uncharacterized protein n=1 Tax=Amphimedon queenslandica TaxID=400682 RepID=A0A1X7TUD1_AMPQE
GLAPDVMHDILEGVAQYEVKELLKHLIGDKFITVNGTIETFPYCHSDVNEKPPVISKKCLILQIIVQKRK